ncbi:SusC/RagA family TonB-linked outer membrane protein [Hymenobacter jejuensis]|uniref:SusC/RagA family TonB-linked outer membrane protein n=2 Tax=Hymenobacter jejuensis TaxID=2502781 RepID=A0A5B8A5C4_9BACT|nr:SusC/RagA family TonB-linked outer membrane protein [Hymenobacter jejuensis]
MLAILIPLLSMAQANRPISGKVVDAQGNGLPGVTIIVPGTTVGTSSGGDGSFQLQVPESATTLAFSFVGYSSQQVNITGKSTVEVALKEDAQALKEVVVVGYGTARKQDLTGSVSVVGKEDFNKGTYTSPDQLLQGRTSGVQITNNSGQPGGAAAVRIRGISAVTGTGQPLYVVDGVPLDGRTARPGLATAGLGNGADSNPLNFLNPNDIESVTVLKDASATAIYGSRAAYGVVLINTKRGKAGAPQLDFTVSGGVSTLLRRLKVLDASQYRRALTYYDASPSNDLGGDVDALDAILRTGSVQNYNVALSGGNEMGRYRVSLGYLDQKGIVRKTDFKKYSTAVATNFTFLESKKLGIDINLNASQFREQLAPISNNAGFQGSLIGQALQWNPTNPLRLNDTLNILRGSTTVNPLAQSELYDDNSRVTTVLGSVSPYYKFADWLEYRLLYSVNYGTGVRRTSIDSRLNLQDYAGSGFVAVGQNELLTQQVTNTLNFNKKITADLNLNAVLGYEYTKFSNSIVNLNALGPKGGFGKNGLDPTNYLQITNPSARNLYSFTDPNTALQSYFGRAILNYKERYLLTATLRADGSSKFGANNRYGYFPSFSAAWDVSQESFFQVAPISQFKVRVGYGRTGNQEFPAGSSQGQLSFLFNGNGASGQLTNPNPDLKWQSDEQYNAGIDLALFNNRLTLTGDYFRKVTTDLLFPTTAGFPAAPGAVVTWRNLSGQVLNKGVELGLTSTILDQPDGFGLSINGNATFIKNRVSDLLGPIFTGDLNGQGLSGVQVQAITNGYPINAFFVQQFEGIDPTTGQASYADQGRTRYVGNPNPRALLGGGVTARYKKLALVANVTGVSGVDVYNNTFNSVVNVSQIRTGKNIALANFEAPVKEALSNPVAPSSRFIEDASYLKLSNLTLSYSVGDLSKVFKGTNVYITGQNLFVITNYNGFDPEVNTNKGSSTGPSNSATGAPPSSSVPSVGIDYIGYPPARTFTIGLSVSL